MSVDGQAIEDNIYNPEATKTPLTIVVEVKLSKQIHTEREKGEKGNYNLALEVAFGLVNKYYEKYPDTDIDKDLDLLKLDKFPGEYTGDKQRDDLLLAIYELHNPEDYSYRWFRSDGEVGYGYKSKSFEEIVKNLDKFGTEIDIEKEELPSYLSSDSPLFWQSIGWPNNNVTESYLLVFPAHGLRRNRQWVDGGPVMGSDFSTRFDSKAPALNERQKVLIKISWVD